MFPLASWGLGTMIVTRAVEREGRGGDGASRVGLEPTMIVTREVGAHEANSVRSTVFNLNCGAVYPQKFRLSSTFCIFFRSDHDSDQRGGTTTG